MAEARPKLICQVWNSYDEMGLPPFEYWMFRLLWPIGLGIMVYWMLTEMPSELAEWFKDYRIWKAKRAASRTGQLEEVEQKCPK